MKPSPGFVTCVEAGPLESMVVRLCESIRELGGEYGESNIYAVSPRYSPPLARSTRMAFDRMRVTYLAKPTTHRYAWYHFLNKPLSMLAASEASAEEVLVWMDADTLVVRPPVGLQLDDSEKVGVCAPCVDIIGSTGNGDPRDTWWRQICSAAGVRLDALPYIKTHASNRQVRLYLQAGIFGLRRGSGFAETYLSMCERLLSSRIALQNGPHWLEQIALGLALVSGKFRWREWPWTVNYAVGSFIRDRYTRVEFQTAQILHYHDEMEPQNFPVFLDHVRSLGSAPFQLLKGLGPTNNPQGRFSRAQVLPVTWARKLRRRLHVLRSRNITAVAT